MKRVKPSTKERLKEAIEILRHVQAELSDGKEFSAFITGTVAEGLENMINEGWKSFSLDLPYSGWSSVSSLDPRKPRFRWDGEGTLSIHQILPKSEIINPFLGGK